MTPQNQITVRGIVLDSSVLREFDKRIVLLTPNLGRITVFANYARREKNGIKAVCQKFVMGSFDVIRSGSAYKLVGARIEEYFPGLLTDLDRLVYASYANEFAEYFTRENVEAKHELNLLFYTYHAILEGKLPLELIRRVYELKMLQIAGYGLEVNECIKCHETEGLAFLDFSSGGVVCQDCVKKGRANYDAKVSQECLYILQYVFSRKLKELYRFNINEETLKQVEKFTDLYVKEHCTYHFKSLDILKPFM